MKKQVDTKKEEQLKTELDDWKRKYLRALADYQNLEKRVNLTRGEETKFATKNLVLKILPVLDVLEKAAKTLKDQGLDLALRQFKEVLKNEQIEKLEVVGKNFDPHKMECVEVVEGEDDKVVEEVRSGYTMWGKVIRVSQVKVGKKISNKREEELAKQELQKGDYM